MNKNSQEHILIINLTRKIQPAYFILIKFLDFTGNFIKTFDTDNFRAK